MAEQHEINTLGELIKKIIFILFSFSLMKDKKQVGGTIQVNNKTVRTGDDILSEASRLFKDGLNASIRKMKAIGIMFVYAAMYPVIPFYAVMSSTFSFLLYALSNLRIF